MNDLIKREELLDYLRTIPIDLGYREMEDVVTFVEKMKSVNAVEVVRCKDCRFYFFVEGEDRGECDERIDRFRPFYPNDFCSYGERIDNDS